MGIMVKQTVSLDVVPSGVLQIYCFPKWVMVARLSNGAGRWLAVS
jgi:hypothetical protein